MPIVDPGTPTSIGGWRATGSGSADPAVLRDRVTFAGQPVELYHWHDFEVESPSAGGNLFDIVADVDWTHEDGTTVRESQAFYSGSGGTFVFRFGAEKLGRWTGVTSSAVPELDGLVLDAVVTELTNPNRSGYHVFDPLNPTWWMQQKGPSGNAVRIAPRFVMWDTVEKIAVDENLQDQVDLWADTYGFTGANPNHPVSRWFDIDDGPIVEDWHLDQIPSTANPDPATFEAIEKLIDPWLDKGGHVHLWQYADAQRNGASTDMPGGANGTLSQRLDRYITARLGPIPGWSLEYGFDNWESIDATNAGIWMDRISTRIGWFHWVGCRFVDVRTAPVQMGNPWNNCEDDVVRTGGYPNCSLPWNQATTSPPQFASWEQHWPGVVGRDENTTLQDIIDGILANTAAGEAFISDRPHFSADRFRDSTAPETIFETDAEVPAVLRGYGLAGWAATYGKLLPNGGSHNFTSAPWSNPVDVKAANDEITAAMENS